MAINTVRPSQDSSVLNRQVGADATESTTTTTSADTTESDTSTTARSNPIGTSTAKLLNGDTQDQDNALQKLKYDAYDVYNKKADYADIKADTSASADDIAAAETAMTTAQTAYAADLKEVSGEGLTGTRIQRYLTGGAHPVPDNALIPSSDSDISDLLTSLGTLDTDTDTSTASTTTSTSTATTATVKNVDSSLTSSQQAVLANSQEVLSTDEVSQDLVSKTKTDDGVSQSEAQKEAVTSGAAKSFTLYPNGDAPSADDVNQYKSEDCYWMSAMASMASSTKGQAELKNAISGPDAKTGDFIVTLHAPSGDPVDIAVNPNNIPVNTDGTPAFSNGTDGGANWVNLMQAAYAKYNDAYKVNTGSSSDGTQNSTKSGYDAIMMNSIDDTSFNFALTGVKSTATTVQGADQAATTSQMKSSLAAGLPVEAYNLDTADTEDSEGNTIVASHSYAVVNISADGSQITVKNPWGEHDPKTGQDDKGNIVMSADDFYKTFEQVNS